VHPDAKKIADHMKDFGLCLLGKAIVDVTFSEMMNPYGHAMGVTSCAHAAEIIIKARIAQEHPLLIFSKLPKPDPIPGSLLGLNELLTEGRTLTYNELPDALWAATGYRIPLLKQFNDFGRLRNTIVHVGSPDDKTLSEKTLRFAFKVLEPMIYHFWKSDILEYIGEYDPDADEYVFEALKDCKIRFKKRK